MSEAQTASSNPPEAGGVTGCEAEQALPKGPRRGTADPAQQHSVEATCTSIPLS